MIVATPRLFIGLWSLALLGSCSALPQPSPSLPSLAKRDLFPTSTGPIDNSTAPLDVFLQVLNMQPNPDADVLASVVAFDATYVSLTFDNPDLHAILPWAGTRSKVGPQAFIDTFTRVGLWWERGPFTIQRIFGDGGNVTAWGVFEVTSRTLGKTVSSPWSSRAEVNAQGKITYFQYMEDTFATTKTFWASGEKEFKANPFGGSVRL